MAASKRELAELRQLAARRTRAAGNKISRIKSQTGAIISGTEYDPRVSRAKLARYNSTQLRAYIERVNDFQNSNRQFVALADSTPAPRHLFRQYQRAEREANRQRAEALGKVADVVLPHGGTIRQQAGLFGREKWDRNMITTSKTKPINREANQITSVANLRKLTNELKSEVTIRSRDAALASKWEQARKMFNEIGDKELSAELEMLSDSQFETLWDYSNFASTLSINYSQMQAKLTGERYNAAILNQTNEGVAEFLGWAARL